MNHNSAIEFAFPRLARSTGPEALDVQLAAIEYALASPIIIRDQSDIKSIKHWSESLEPFEHQVRNLITFCRRAPVALIADDVGLGKTISAGLILSELLTRKRVKRALVLAPKILLPQWAEELESKFSIKAKHGVGKELDSLLDSRTQVVITTYASMTKRLPDIGQHGFDMIILDEAHKLCNLYGVPVPPQSAKAMKQALGAGAFRYVLMLTATPIQNRLWDLYSLVDLLTTARRHTNPFGTPSDFASRYLADGRTKARVLRQEQAGHFRKQLQDYMVRTSRGDAKLVFPSRTVETISCRKGAVEEKLEALVRANLAGLKILQKVSLAEALMSSPAALAAQLKNMAEEGTVPRAAAAAAADLASQSPLGCKFSYLRDLAQKLRAENPTDWRMVVFTRRTETQREIGAALQEMGARVGYIRGGAMTKAERDIAGFKASPPTVNVLVSTDSGAAGVNLQAGNVVVNYDLPWNPMVVEQRIGRVQRLASKFSSVLAVNLVVEGSVEELVVARLMEKLQAIASTIGDIEGILEAVDRPPQGESDEAFEKALRDLVLNALEGQDVAEATQHMQASIARAKQLYEEGRQVVDQTVGRLDEMHDAGPEVPDLAPPAPRMPVADFVKKAYTASNASVTEGPDGRLTVTVPGALRTTITFDEADPELLKAPGYFGGRGVVFYAPGEAAFEKLVGRWDSRRQHQVERPEVDREASCTEAATAWLSGLGHDAALVSCTMLKETSDFEGTVYLRVGASVAHDRYEKLLDVPIGRSSPREGSERATSRGFSALDGDDLLPDRMPAHLHASFNSAIEADPDITAFCHFYRARKAEELKRTQNEPERARVISSNFEPSIRAEVVGARGTLAPLVEARIQYTHGSSPTYESTLVIDAQSQEVLSGPELGQCAVTGQLVPATDLANCDVSGKQALAHLLVISEISGRRGLPELAVRCELTDKLVLSDEVGVSEISGRVVVKSELRECAMSYRTAASDEMARCDFSGTYVLHEFLAHSAVSGRPYRKDEGAISAVSRTAGHRSEFVRCEETGATVLEHETGISWQSGKRVRADLLEPSPKNPSHRGLASEFAKCEISGKRLLLGELVASSVSGRLADKDLMPTSAVSGLPALPAELILCEASGTQVLPAETGVCSGTGKRVRLDLLARSEISGKEALREFLHVCPETGVMALADELETCQRTGLRVNPSALVTCSATGLRVVKRLTVTCPGCGEALLRDHAAPSADGALGHKEHLRISDATGAEHFPQRLKRCKVTDLLVESEFVNSEGVLDALMRAASKAEARELEDPSIIDQARPAFTTWGIRPHRAWSEGVSGTHLVATFVEWPGMLGLSRKQGCGVVDIRDGSAVGMFADAVRTRGYIGARGHGVQTATWNFHPRKG